MTVFNEQGHERIIQSLNKEYLEGTWTEGNGLLEEDSRDLEP